MFTGGPLVLEQLDDRLWRLTQPLVYQGNTDEFTVEAGFVTDLASVPRPFWWLVPRSGRYTPAAVLHDFLCKEARDGRFSRCDADGIFRRTLRELEVSWLRRRLMWAAVRWGGGVASCGLGQLVLVLLLSLLALPIALPGLALVLALLALFWLFEVIVYGVRRASGRPVSFPQFLWWT